MLLLQATGFGDEPGSGDAPTQAVVQQPTALPTTIHKLGALGLLAAVVTCGVMKKVRSLQEKGMDSNS